MTTYLETDRLILRQLTAEDTQFIISLVNSPGWLQYIGDRNIHTDEEAKTYIENGPVKSYEKNGFGLCAVVLKSSNLPIGMCGIIWRNTLDAPDIGFAFLPEYLGKGYGYEVASATLAYAKDVLKLPVILAITVAYNTPSIKLLEKIGLKYVKTFCYEESEEELMLYKSGEYKE